MIRQTSSGFIVLVVTLFCSSKDLSNVLSLAPVTKSLVRPSGMISKFNMCSSTRLMALKDQDEIDTVTKEAEDAISAATSLMTDTDSLLKSKNFPPPPPPPQRQVSVTSLSSLEQTRLIAATFSGTVLGAILSVILETQLDDIGGVEPFVLTGVLAVALGATTFAIGKNPNENNLIPKSVRYFLGQPILNLGDAIRQQITSSIERTKEEITSIPTKIQNKVEQTVDDTVTTIQNIPSNVQRGIEKQIQQTQDAAAQKVQDTVTSIQQIPDKVKDAALDIADEIVTEIKATPTRMKDAALDIADEIVTEIKATPEKVQKSATAFVQDTIDDITAIPSKMVASVESTINSAGGASTLPQPPKLPPPIPQPPKKVEPEFSLPEIPKVEIPKIELPTLPVLDLPSLPKVDLPSAAKVEIQVRRPPTSTVPVPIKKSVQPKVDAAAIAKKKAQEQAAAAAAAAKIKAQQELEAAKRKKKREQEQLEQQKAKLQQAKSAAAEREKQQLAQQAAKDERERQRLAAEQEREQEILRKAEEALQRSREVEQKKKRQEMERKKQQEEAAKKRQEQLAEQQAAAQLQKQSSGINGATSTSGSFRIAATPSNRAPRGVPTIISWKQRKDGGISGRIYGSTNFNDGERIETSVIASGTLENGFVVKTDSGSRYFLSNEKPNTREPTPDSTGPIQSLLSALPGATITLTKSAKDKASAQKEAAMKKKADSIKPRPTFSLFGSPIAPAPSSETNTKVAKKVAPRGIPTIQRWRKNRDGSLTGLIYGSSSFSDGEQVTTSPIASGTLESGEIVRTGSGSRYFLG